MTQQAPYIKFIIATLLALLLVLPSPAGAVIRPTPPSPIPTTTTTTAPSGPEHHVIPCGYWSENWFVAYDIQAGDTVEYCGKTYTIGHHEDPCVSPSFSLTGVRPNKDYAQPVRFSIQTDEEISRYRMRVYDDTDTKVRTRNRREGTDKFERPFVLRRLPAGTYDIEITAWLTGNDCFDTSVIMFSIVLH